MNILQFTHIAIDRLCQSHVKLCVVRSLHNISSPVETFTTRLPS
ncbi:MAG: hypothetical protein V7K47_24365 [Nostoc sp.]